MIKTCISKPCQQCNGKAYLSVGEASSYSSENYQRYITCPQCKGFGNPTNWISSNELVCEPEQSTCPHEHISYIGGMHYSDGEVWDDIIEICDDCGATLD